MTTLEKSGKSIEIALAAALEELGTTREHVLIDVIEEARKGFFGIGSRDARIRVTLKEETVVETTTEAAPEEVSVVAPVVETVKEMAVAAVNASADAEEKGESAAPAQESPAEAGETEQAEERSYREARPAREERPYRRERRERRDRGYRSREYREPRQDVYDEAEREFVVDENAVAMAKEFLNKIFAAMNIHVSMEKFVNRQTQSVVLKLHGDDMGILIGKHGQTLDALQYLTNLVANKNSENRMHIVIDVEDYRNRRTETLTRLAHRLAEKVKHTGERVVLEPMNPHERKIIHTALQGDRSITTLSEGSDPYRKVVIELKR